MNAAGNAFQPPAHDLVCINITLRIQTEKYRFHTMIAINRCQLIIIPVQYNMAARLHGLEDFRLCFENSVSVAKISR